MVGVEYVVNNFAYSDGRHAVTDIARYGKVHRGAPGTGSTAVYESVHHLPYDEPDNEEFVAYSRDVLNAFGVRFSPAHTEVMLTAGARYLSGSAPGLPVVACPKVPGSPPVTTRSTAPSGISMGNGTSGWNRA